MARVMGWSEPVHRLRPGGLPFLFLALHALFKHFRKALLHRVGSLPEGGTFFRGKVAHVRHEFGKLPLATEKVHPGRLKFRFRGNPAQTFIKLAGQSVQLFKEIHGKALWQAALPRFCVLK